MKLADPGQSTMSLSRAQDPVRARARRDTRAATAHPLPHAASAWARSRCPSSSCFTRCPRPPTPINSVAKPVWGEGGWGWAPCRANTSPASLPQTCQCFSCAYPRCGQRASVSERFRRMGLPPMGPGEATAALAASELKTKEAPDDVAPTATKDAMDVSPSADVGGAAPAGISGTTAGMCA